MSSRPSLSRRTTENSGREGISRAGPSLNDAASSYNADETVWQQEDPHDQGLVDAEAPSENESLIIPLQRASRCQCFCRLLIIFLLVSFLLYVIVDLSTTRNIETEALLFLNWVAIHPVKGVLAVIVMYAIATVLFMPSAVLTVGAGFAFHSAFGSFTEGVILGSIAVFIGAVIGSISAFLLGRYLFRQTVISLAGRYPMFRAIDRALEGNGLKIMFLLRLSPLIPYNALDYISGVTSIPLWAYACAMIGMLPGTVMFVAIGAAASSLSDGQQWSQENKILNISAIASGLVCAIGGVAVASYYSKIELEKILEQEQTQRALLASSSSGNLYPSRPYVVDSEINLHEIGGYDYDPEQKALRGIS